MIYIYMYVYTKLFLSLSYNEKLFSTSEIALLYISDKNMKILYFFL